MALSALGVWAIHSIGPWILLRDQKLSSWEYRRLGLEKLKEAGSPREDPEYRRNLDEAEAHFRTAIELSPQIGTYRFDLAQTLHALGRTEEALEEGSKGVPYSDPKDPFPPSFLGTLALDLERWSEAEAYLRRAVELDSEDAASREKLARSLLAQGKVDAGIEVWRERLERLPTSIWSRVLAGMSAARVGRWKEAAEWMETPAKDGQLRSGQWLIYAVAKAAVGEIDATAVAFAAYNREQGFQPTTMPDLSNLGLPPLDPTIQGRLKAAYRRGFAAEWR